MVCAVMEENWRSPPRRLDCCCHQTQTCKVDKSVMTMDTTCVAGGCSLAAKDMTKKSSSCVNDCRCLSVPKGSHWWQLGRKYNDNRHNYKPELLLTNLSSFCSYLVMCFMVLVATGTATGAETLELSYTVREEGQSGMFVGDVFQDGDFFNKYEGNADILSKLRFLFLRGEQETFTIDNSTGVIRTTRLIDREGVIFDCANKVDCDIRLDVAVQPAQYFEIIRVTVKIDDINDHMPTFSERQVTHQILESFLPGTNILIFNVQDLDSPDYSIQRFELLPASNSKFRVTSSSQPDGSKEVRLKLQEPLDRESESQYNLRIVAYDGGTPMNTGSIDIQILVLDTNDNNPTFVNPTYEVDIPEDVRIPTVIITVEATDPDSGTNGEVLYGFSTSTLKNHGDIFSINQESGEISVIKSLDFEKISAYHLGVTAMDKGPTAVASDAMVVVKVIDVNDHAPEISVSTLSAGDAALIPEKSPIGTFVSHISVTDKDKGVNAEVVCSLDSTDFSLEYLYDTEYQIVSMTEFDRETKSMYNVIITCTDGGDEPKSSQRLIPITVSDINDQPPVFEQATYDAEVLENSFRGAVAVQVKATDGDIGTNAEIRYNLEDDMKHLFMVDQLTGEVKARVALDREQVNQFQFQVYAADQGVPAMTATASVVVHVLDINDEVPKFSQPTYSFGVFENEPVGTDVGAISAEDGDSFPFNQFNYTFRTQSEEFKIDPKTGQITAKKVLDRESRAVYHLTAIAVESGKSPTSTVSLSIFIADMNDNPPIFTFPNHINSTIYLSKDVPLGYIATRVEAYDEDIGNSARIIYRIGSGNEDKLFDIDSSRGTLIVIKDLTSYEDKIFRFNISASDSGIPHFTTHTTLNVIINGTMPLQPPTGQQMNNNLGGNNLVIVIALASTSGVITIILVMAIICIRRQDRNRQQSNGKYNCRMEALKFLSVHKRSKNKLVGGSTTSSSGSGSSVTGGSDHGSDVVRTKKEVSFSLEEDASGGELTGDNDKSRKSWPSAIDNSMLQNPRACSSLLNTVSPPVVNTNHYDHHGNLRGQVYPGNGHLHTIAATQREIEIAQLLEMLKRDQDSSSLTSGEGSNTDSGRGASEEGDTLTLTGPRGDLTHSQGLSHLPTVPEDISYTSSNQVVPTCCDSSLSFMSHHNSTIGSYLPPEHVRAASRNSNNNQRLMANGRQQLKTFQNSTLSSVGIVNGDDKSESTILSMSDVSSSIIDQGHFYKTNSPPPKQQQQRLKSILKQPSNTNISVTSSEQVTPLAQQGMVNYLRHRMAARMERGSGEDGELSDIEESELTESAIRYSCVDVSDILNSKLARSPGAQEDDDDDVTTTSGSYTVDPKELCDEIDQLFFKNMT